MEVGLVGLSGMMGRDGLDGMGMGMRGRSRIVMQKLCTQMPRRRAAGWEQDGPVNQLARTPCSPFKLAGIWQRQVASGMERNHRQAIQYRQSRHVNHCTGTEYQRHAGYVSMEAMSEEEIGGSKKRRALARAAVRQRKELPRAARRRMHAKSQTRQNRAQYGAEQRRVITHQPV